jgi:hypothetical protein
MGIRNSSLTRVRPFFHMLIKRDPSGLSWLPEILVLAPNRRLFPHEDLLTNPGPLGLVGLDNERRLNPPEEFLRWLIEHPDKMRWPNNGKARFSPDVQRWREKLMGTRDLSGESERRILEIRRSDRQEAIQKALAKLAVHGAAGSFRQWWAFEGRTAVACFLPAKRLRVYVEGKRTDVLSPSTDWYPCRNQLTRNLESAREDANGVPFACLVIAEQRLPANMEVIIDSGLPHFTQRERQDLFHHFLGSITWREAAEATRIAYDDLPDTV